MIHLQKRNNSIDNIKAVLIFLVVFGHLIELHFASDPVLKPVWIFIYSFHMPMFALISGMVSKASLNEKQTLQLVKNIIIPLICFEFLYEAIEFLVRGETSEYSKIFAPYWMLWYLLSLFFWRLLLPIFSKLQFPLMLAVLISLLASYTESSGYFLSISRTLSFFPYFLLGYILGPQVLKARNSKVILLCAGILLLAMVGASMIEFDYRALYGSYSLKRLGSANLKGSLLQMLQYLISCLIGCAFLQLLIQKNWGLAGIGKRSMYVFAWHGLALIILNKSGLLASLFSHPGIIALLLTLFVSAIIVWLSAHQRCEEWTKRFLLSPLEWLLIRDSSLTSTVPLPVPVPVILGQVETIAAKVKTI